MSRLLLPPAVVVVVTDAAVGIAFVLDNGGIAQHDAAVLIGTAGLWVLGAGTLWLIAALVHLVGRRRRLPRS